MADPVRQQIVAEVATRLAALPGIAEVQIMPPGDPAAFPALHVYDDGDRPAESEGEAGTCAWIMTLGLDGYVKGGAGVEAHAALNALYADAVEVLLTEPVLGGLAQEIDVSAFRPTVTERANARRLAFSMDLSIHYATARGRPRAIT